MSRSSLRFPRDLSLRRACRAPAIIAILLCLLPAAGAQAEDPVAFQRYATEHYDLFTNLTKAEAQPIGRHMDAVFTEYARRFERAGLERIRHGRMPLYLLRTQDDYLRFLKSAGLDATNTSGLFFIQQRLQGLATWTQGRSLSETYGVLQHEGFHQFAHAHFRASLPIWVNEGLAEYFEDAILVSGSLKVGIVSGRRVTTLKNAIRAGKVVPMGEVLSIRDDQWLSSIRANPQTAALMYDQAWSIVHFLISLPRDRGGALFESYLRDLGKGVPHAQAWAAAYGAIDPERLEAAWRQHVLKLKADDLHTALANMEFLASAMRYLHERGKTPPPSLAELRRAMQGIGFSAVRRQHGYTVRTSAQDETVYQYAPQENVRRSFILLEPARADLLPRITAPGLSPEPTLTWLRDATGALTTVIEYR